MKTELKELIKGKSLLLNLTKLNNKEKSKVKLFLLTSLPIPEFDKQLYLSRKDDIYTRKFLEVYLNTKGNLSIRIYSMNIDDRKYKYNISSNKLLSITTKDLKQLKLMKLLKNE